MTNFGLKVNGM